MADNIADSHAREFVAELLSYNSFLLITHVRPDGDALGSQIALGYFLTSQGKVVTMINSDPPPLNLGWLPGIEEVGVYNGELSQLEMMDQAEVVVVLDANAAHRLGDAGKRIDQKKAFSVLIDHHTGPENWFSKSYARETASSTGELVYELIVAHDPGAIDATIATALYTAIMTDTGSFRYTAVTPGLHRIIADILEKGEIQPAPIHTAVFDTRSSNSLRLLSMVLSTLALKFNNKLAYMVIYQKMLKETGASSDETDGFVNYALSIEGVEAGLLFLETSKGTKVSFRSKVGTEVNKWAQKLGGGGHIYASGAFLKMGVRDAIERVMETAPGYFSFAESSMDQAFSDEDLSYLYSLKAKQDR